MKMLYSRKTHVLMAADDVLVGDIDPLIHRTTQEKALGIISQDRPLVLEDAESKEKDPEPFGVWICYIVDDHGDPIMVKLVSTDVQAHEWVQGRPRTLGLIDDGTRGNRFVEYHTVEVERP